MSEQIDTEVNERFWESLKQDKPKTYTSADIQALREKVTEAKHVESRKLLKLDGLTAYHAAIDGVIALIDKMIKEGE